MSVLQALAMGLLQGATEFIPVSSSGHLVLVPWLLHWPEPGLAFSAVLHWGTVLAVLVIFWRDLRRLLSAAAQSVHTRSLASPQARLAWWILLATLPAAILGLLFKDLFERLFNTPAAAAAFLLTTALILLLGEHLGRGEHPAEAMGWRDALWVGFAQAAAMAPGVSRSGATIAAGLWRGLQREEAARFSFLLAVPTILGAGLLSLLELAQQGILLASWSTLLTGFVAAALSGALAIRWLLAYLARRSMTLFAAYCAAAGSLGLLVSVLRA